MARKSSEIPVHVRERIISLRKNNYSRKISEIVKLNFSTVRYIVTRYEKSSNIKNKPRSD